MDRQAAAQTPLPPARRIRGARPWPWIGAVVAAAVLAAIAYDTKVVRLSAGGETGPQAFSADAFGEKEFPRIRDLAIQRAVDAQTLGPAALADKTAAIKQYGTESSTGAVMPVKLTGTLGEAKSGVYDVKVEGLPPDIRVRVQTGPAINGTDLRDFDPEIKFGQFKNQIEYQDAGSGINRAMKKATLDGLDAAHLTGKTIDLVGVFRLINPKNWLITPVKATVK